VLLLALLALAVRADDVLVLTASNFDETVNKADIILVEFYAPWCGHCKHLEPEYAKAATVLKKEGVLLGKVDATVESDLATRFGVRGYPTLKVFRQGTASEYSGPREADGIVSYMRKQAAPALSKLETEEAFAKLTESRDPVVIGFFPNSKDSELEKSISSLSSSLRDDEFKFGVVHDAALAKAKGYTADTVVLYQKLDNAKFDYTGAADKQAVQNWVWDNSVPLAGEYTRENSKKYTRKHVPTVLAFIDVDFGSNLKRTNYYLNRLRKVAQGANGKFTFAVASKKAFAADLDKYGCDQSKEFCVGLDDGANTGRYKYEAKEFNVEGLQKLIADFTAGNLQPWIKSEPVPESNDGDVTVVVGKTFKDIVLNPQKDVLIELYAPWCGHCKNLEPAYKELGARIKKEGVKTVTIAKMDATANDVSNSAYQANGYPTILFAKAGSKNSPLKYEGARDADSMFKWIKEKATGFNKDEL
jgi:protein disulfide isomerase